MRGTNFFVKIQKFPSTRSWNTPIFCPLLILVGVSESAHRKPFLIFFLPGWKWRVCNHPSKYFFTGYVKWGYGIFTPPCKRLLINLCFVIIQSPSHIFGGEGHHIFRIFPISDYNVKYKTSSLFNLYHYQRSFLIINIFKESGKLE